MAERLADRPKNAAAGTKSSAITKILNREKLYATA